MPFEIVRNDITEMKVDAIVNTANPKSIIGAGVDFGIHKKAGPKLLKDRLKIGEISVGKAEITHAYELNAKYVIHTVGPEWVNGSENECERLAECYKNSLALAQKHKCNSIAFPLISSGNCGFPKDKALQTAINEISGFLLNSEMKVYLVVFEDESLHISEKLFSNVKSYIDEKYVSEKLREEFCTDDVLESCSRPQIDGRFFEERKSSPRNPFLSGAGSFRANECTSSAFIMQNHSAPQSPSLENMLKQLDEGFSETLLKLIDRSGKKDSEIYKKANIDRKLFSKIRSNPNYKPSKTTALAFAFALELSLEETKDFISRAGFAISHSSKFDIIIEYFLINKNYDVYELNQVLFSFDQPLIGA